MLAVNDHLLKGRGLLPGWLTGKLSDVAGLFFFPILLFALSGLVWAAPSAPRARTRRAAWLAAVTTIVFAATKLSTSANAVANAVLGPTAMDPTDLFACPAAVLAVVYVRRAPRPRAPARAVALRDRALVLLAAVASMATSRTNAPRSFPTWRVEAPRADALCTAIRADVVKSGKEGVGVVLLRETPRCPLRVESAALRAGDRAHRALAIAPWDEHETTYLAFLFDNEALWNAGVRHGQLELVFSAGAERRAMVFSMVHAWDGWHGAPRTPPAPLPPSTPRPAATEGIP